MYVSEILSLSDNFYHHAAQQNEAEHAGRNQLATPTPVH